MTVGALLAAPRVGQALPLHFMNLQKINWKIFFKNPSVAKPDDFFCVFNSWIGLSDNPEIFIDVADYQHVHDGPVTILIGHYADFALDDSDRKRGLLYSRKRGEIGGNQEKLNRSLAAALKGAERLEKDPIFGGKISFKTSELQLIVNDRALAPNTSQTFQSLKPDLDKFCTSIFGVGDYSLKHLSHPKQRFSVLIETQKDWKDVLAGMR